MSERCCCACGTTRDLALLLRVSETGGLHRSKFVCRPNVDGRCFRDMVGRRDLERIETALPEAPLLPRPVSRPPTPTWGTPHAATSSQKTAPSNREHSVSTESESARR